jgi:hypothetical protein
MAQLLTEKQVKSLQAEHSIILTVISNNYWAPEYSAHRDRIDEINATLKENAVRQDFLAS